MPFFMATIAIIPAYNEEETIREVVTGALRHCDVSVTNDGSRDRTGEILASIAKECAHREHPHALHVITHETSTHIPRGIQDGMKYAVSKGYAHVITMDAGLSHDPNALPEFMNFDPAVDVVIGMRSSVENVPLYRRLISRLAALLVNYSLTPSLFNLRGPGLRDCTSGFRRYSLRAASVIADAKLKSKSFDFHMEALALAVRSGYSVAQLPIHYVFSNSSFNGRVFRQAAKFGFHLLITKRKGMRNE